MSDARARCGWRDEEDVQLMYVFLDAMEGGGEPDDAEMIANARRLYGDAEVARIESIARDVSTWTVEKMRAAAAPQARRRPRRSRRDACHTVPREKR